MSEELKPTPQKEEVDLGQLFRMIGNFFQSIFNFFGKLFYSLFLAFVWVVFFVKKNIVILGAAVIIGFVLGLVKEKTAEPVYKSSIMLKQNYETGDNLYKFIDYSNSLVAQKDYNSLKSIFSLDEDVLLSIIDLSIEPVVSENDKLKAYDTYRKTLDSVVASTFEYKNFLDNVQDNKYPFQQISIKTNTRNSFKPVFDKIVENINSTPFFIREKEKDLNELKAQKQALENALTSSDSLQKIYKKVLEEDSEALEKTSEIGITIESSRIKVTKEYDLYLNDVKLRREIVEIEREIEEKDEVIQVISTNQESGVIDNKIKILGMSFTPKIVYSFVFVLITFFILLGIRFFKFLEKYKSEIA